MSDERPWGDAQLAAEEMTRRMDEDLRRNYVAKIRQLSLADRLKWQRQDNDGMQIGSDDDRTFEVLVQTALAEIPPHTTLDIELCRALVADLVSNFDQV